MLLSCDAVKFIKTNDFPGIFDTLFVRGGFAAYTVAHGDRDCERFVEDFETPSNDLTIQAVCACRFIQRLPCPCDALMLLVEGDNKVKRLAERCMLRVFDVKVLVLAIRVFCERASRKEVVWDMFPVSRMFERRTRKGWVQFARDMYSNKRRLDKWWAECTEPRGDMRRAIDSMAEREMDCLAEKLMDLLRVNLLEQKAREQQEKRTKEACKGEPAAKKRKSTPRPVTVSKKEETELLCEVESKRTMHKTILAKLEQVMTTKKMTAISANMSGIVGGLARVYPLIKWNLKAVVHRLATRRSAFEIERKLFLHSLDLPATDRARVMLWKMV